MTDQLHLSCRNGISLRANCCLALLWYTIYIVAKCLFIGWSYYWALAVEHQSLWLDPNLITWNFCSCIQQDFHQTSAQNLFTPKNTWKCFWVQCVLISRKIILASTVVMTTCGTAIYRHIVIQAHEGKVSYGLCPKSLPYHCFYSVVL